MDDARETPLHRNLKLPGRIIPLPGEMFFSWLVRFSRANLCEPTQFVQLFWPDQHLFTNAVISAPKASIVSNLSNLSGLQEKNLQGMCIEYFVLNHFIDLTCWHGRSYILSAKARGYRYRGNWLQFCPQCLVEDEKPYFRNIWRLSVLPVCPIHRCELADRCGVCHQPVNFHLVPLNVENIAFCFNCNSLLGMTKTKSYRADSSLFGLSQQIIDGVRDKWVKLNAGCSIPMPLFIGGLFYLLRPFFKKTISTQVIEYFEADIPQKISLINRVETRFESMSLQDRLALMQAASRMLEYWPSEFLKIVSDINLSKVSFTTSTGSLPFWLEQVLDENVFRQPYWVSDVEFETAAKFLSNHGYHVSFANVAEAVGLDRSCHKSAFRNQIINKYTEVSGWKHEVFHWSNYMCRQ